MNWWKICYALPVKLCQWQHEMFCQLLYTLLKVKDDPVLLKKSMKKEEKLKQHSQKKWQERVAHVAEQQQKRQDKRKKNIQAKKQTKVDRKIKLAKKKGRIISGF